MAIGKSRETSSSARTSLINSAVVESLESRRLLDGLTFAPAPTTPPPSTPGALVAADFNGDGIQDIATANKNHTVSILIGNGDGSFKAAVNYPDGLAGASSIVAADINNDGKLDIIVGDAPTSPSLPGLISVLLGNGDGTFKPAQTISANAAQVTSIQVADLNGDGKMDLVTANGDAGSIGILLGNGDGTFQPAQTIMLPCAGSFTQSVPGNAVAMVLTDLNGDGEPDIAVANTIDPPSSSLSFQQPTISEIDVLIGNGNGTFKPVQRISMTGNDPLSLVAVDRTTDNHPDLIAGTAGGGVIELAGNGDGSFAAPVSLMRVGGNVDNIVVGDLNGDGKPDLLLSVYNGYDILQPVIGNGDGTFVLPDSTLKITGERFAYTHIAPVLADFNGDGRLDIGVKPGAYKNAVGVLLNTSTSIPAISYHDRVLNVQGTSGNDTASVILSSGNIVVTVDSTTRQYPDGAFDLINIQLLGGNDSLTIGSGVGAVLAAGMAGNDTIINNSSSRDTLYGGDGADSLVGGAGITMLFGGRGPDTLIGGTGTATLRGGRGNDSLDGSAGTGDFIVDGRGSDTVMASPVMLNDTLPMLVGVTNDILVDQAS